MHKIKTLARKYLFGGKEFYSQLLVIALPIIIQNFIASSLNMVDTVMIGRLGETEIAAVGLANQFFLLFILLVSGIHSGCSVFIAQFWGQGEKEGIRKVLGVALLAAVLVSLLFTVIALFYPEGIVQIFNKDPQVIREGAVYLKVVSLSYVFTAVSFGFAMASRSIGNTLLPMVVSALALGCNTFLNYVLIFGHFGAPQLGVEGAAIATTASRIIEMLVLIVFIYFRSEVLRVRLSDLRGTSTAYLQKIFTTVLPVILNDGCWALGFVVYSVAYGRISTQAFAAVQITNTIQNLFTVAIYGMASASAVMVGHKIGEGNEEDGANYAWRFSALAWLGGLLIGGLMAATSPSILSLFNVSANVYHSALRIQYITSLVMVIRVFNIVHIIGVLRGGGDVRFSLIAEAFTMWCIGVPLAFFGAFVLHLPVEGVVALVMAEEVAKFTAIMFRLVSKRWINNVVHEIDEIAICER
ncbi:MATE family efflux transporter [Syntrophaceticus schinkii]|uniref:Na+ driven multidrug efflux pump n=1 Tax=Syntrophaceticus schinkii TaxID=499207 RepID=A0A0B7MRH2_9FIRM|nr:MATE family efflux transporter [Syntrophaceticus schinkii]MDD2360711.1 MATE family efflux transporter [Syntrophaceticus schinkii]MDD4261991.1 MATE family efflux transporter [Syntrophaceticus schinkii]MDD4675341.1 MATE family efflux transporter [Syntrophaceticus schinkii]CEO90247.1 Na+ driven multidrug efflux pump [Syntrophaceticus schinkii]